MKKKSLIFFVLACIFLHANTITLMKGWNAVGLNADMNLSEIESQLGNKLLIIQSPDGSESYNYKAPSFIKQTFTHFKIGMGYWIKVNEKGTLSYTPININKFSIKLVKGWNLIAPLTDLNLSEMESQLGNKLLIIQSPDGSESYNYKAPSFLKQSFTHFKANSIAYWIKVKDDANLTFYKNNSLLTKTAVNGELKPSEIYYNGLEIKVFTNGNAPQTTSQNIILYFKINGVQKQIGVNNLYPEGTKFQIAVYENNKLIKYSAIKIYNNSDYIDFGEINVSNNNVTETNNTKETNNSIVYPHSDVNESSENIIYPPQPGIDENSSNVDFPPPSPGK